MRLLGKGVKGEGKREREGGGEKEWERMGIHTRRSENNF